MNAAAVGLRAYAKVNLTLEILGRRADGFHEIRSVMQTIALWDDVVVGADPGQGVTIDAPRGWDVPHDVTNLAVQALRRFAAESGAGASLRLHKRIPPAAGLGGGSADAAAALRGCDLLTAAPFGDAWLQQLAAGLGSDVPFFIRGGTQAAAGRGELLTPLPDLPAAWLVLVVPPIALPHKTAALYAMVDADAFTRGNRSIALEHAIGSGYRLEPGLLFNGFDTVAARAFAGLGGYRDALAARCGHAVLCGAGPALFALTASEAQAREAAATLTADGIAAHAVRTVDRAEVAQFER